MYTPPHPTNTTLNRRPAQTDTFYAQNLIDIHINIFNVKLLKI